MIQTHDLRTELATRLFELATQVKVRPTHRSRDLAYKRELLEDGRRLLAYVAPDDMLIRLKNLVVDAERRVKLIADEDWFNGFRIAAGWNL